MGRFVIEHLPRNPAKYAVTPLDSTEAKAWIEQSACHSLVRTTELIEAIATGLGLTLTQSDSSMSLREGDEAVLISLSYGVLLAAAEGSIPPLSEDWRCSLLRVEGPGAEVFGFSAAEVVAEEARGA